MSRFQQGSLLKLKRKSGPDVWVFRWYDESSGTRTYKKRTLGTVIDLPQRRDAEKAVADFRANINVEVRVPVMVSELIAHYRKHELTPDRKAFATIESTSIYLTNHIAPRWGEKWLSDVHTVEVEEWLHSLPFAPATKSKIRNIMSAVFNHAIRYEWMHHNPITKVRASAKRLREPDVLTPAEFAALVYELPLREKAMVMLAGSTGGGPNSSRSPGETSIRFLCRSMFSVPAFAGASGIPRPRPAGSPFHCIRQSSNVYTPGERNHHTKGRMTFFFLLLVMRERRR
jgi:hypothetical protein